MIGSILGVALAWYVLGNEGVGNVVSATRDGAAGATVGVKAEAKAYKERQYKKYKVK